VIPVHIAPRAELDLLAIDAWWRAERRMAPDLFWEEFIETTELLRTWPELGRVYPSDVPGTRRLLLRSSRYHVYYAFDGAQATILALHSAVRGRGPEL
jgi:plasmid stabilization system protein ParE